MILTPPRYGQHLTKEQVDALIAPRPDSIELVESWIAAHDLDLAEAQKLGFAAAVLPRRLARGGRPPAALDGFRLSETGHLADLVAPFAERTVRSEKPARAAAAKSA